MGYLSGFMELPGISPTSRAHWNFLGIRMLPDVSWPLRVKNMHEALESSFEIAANALAPAEICRD